MRSSECGPAPRQIPSCGGCSSGAVAAFVAAMGDGDAAIACPSLPAGLGLKGRCFWIFVYAATVDDARRWHREHGVPDDVSWATLADLGQQVMLHRRRHGTTGLDLQWWLVLHFTGTIYELGRLQFHMHHLFRGPAGPPFWPDADEVERLGPGFRAGDAALGIHIPEHGHLTPESCDESFATARDFFAIALPRAPSTPRHVHVVAARRAARRLPATRPRTSCVSSGGSTSHPVRPTTVGARCGSCSIACPSRSTSSRSARRWRRRSSSTSATGGPGGLAPAGSSSNDPQSSRMAASRRVRSSSFVT